MTLAHGLAAVGFMGLLLSWFPVHVSTWISKDALFLASVGFLLTGLVLVELKAMLAERQAES